MEKTEQQRKRKRLLLVAPLLVLPFVTLAFWALGGGTVKNIPTPSQQSGINGNLPKAKLKPSVLDKMSLYAQADADSAELKNEAGTFNYPSSSMHQDTASGDYPSGMQESGLQYGYEQDPNEYKLRQKISELQSAIGHPAASPSLRATEQIGPATYGLQSGEQNLERLKKMLSGAEIGSSEDSDMRQINAMLEKVMDIQHPERVEAKLKAQSAKDRGRVFAVERPPDELSASLLSSSAAQSAKTTGSNSTQEVSGPEIRNAFYDIDAGGNTADNRHLAIPVVIAQTQALASGESVKMRLTEDVYVGGTLIPKGNFVYGVCTLSGERLKISVQSIRVGNSLFPVNLSGYDLDAIEGIHVPGAITRDAGKEGAGRAIQSIQMMSLDPNITTQAAAAGIEATKGLLSKKVKLIRVTVKADYPLLLLDAKGV